VTLQAEAIVPIFKIVEPLCSYFSTTKHLAFARVETYVWHNNYYAKLCTTELACLLYFMNR